jgi:hypothetical protein
MRHNKRGFSIALMFVLLTGAVLAQEPIKQNKKQAVAPASASNPVVGSGTSGQITKWSGVSGSNTYVVDDSNITEDKLGKVGIGTRTPTSPLTVQGTIETTLGGIKFPDGTTQTTSTAGALFGVAHDSTLAGNGTLASPLGVASPLMVRDLDNPARQPFQVELDQTTFAFSVPAGKRLVIEFVSARANSAPGFSLLSINVVTTVGGVTLQHPFVPVFVGKNGVDNSYTVSQPTRLYADPGTTVDITLGSGTVILSGYFVDVP